VASARRARPLTAAETFGRKLDADRWLATVQADMLRGHWVEPRAGNVLSEYAADWLAHRIRTRELYSSLLRLHILSGLGAVQLARITPDGCAALELPGLTRRHVDLLHGTLTVAETLVEGGSGLSIGPPKPTRLVAPSHSRRPSSPSWTSTWPSSPPRAATAWCFAAPRAA